MKSIRIVQIFQDANLQSGDEGLTKWLEKNSKIYCRDDLQQNEVILFINKKRNIIKILGKKGMMVDRLSGMQTYDFKLRGSQIIKSIGRFFGVSFNNANTHYRKYRTY